MSVPPPPGYRALCPYIAVPEAEAVLAFAEDVFGATLPKPPLRSGTGRLVNAVVEIGDGMVLLAAPQDGTMRQTAMLHVYVAECDATFDAALAAGAEEMMAPTNQFYGDRAALVRDMGANLWWIATRVEDIGADEMQRRTVEAKPT